MRATDTYKAVSPPQRLTGQDMITAIRGATGHTITPNRTSLVSEFDWCAKPLLTLPGVEIKKELVSDIPGISEECHQALKSYLGEKNCQQNCLERST